jgi:2-iminobutanoate/2-iminopropanoate deaminase
MHHSSVNTDKAPPPGHYAQARIIHTPEYDIVYTSLMTGNIPDTDEVVGNDIESQTNQALVNIKSVIEEAGGSLSDIVKVHVLFENIDRDKKGFDSVYNTFFEDILPARTISEVAKVPLSTESTIVGIEAIAYISA